MPPDDPEEPPLDELASPDEPLLLVLLLVAPASLGALDVVEPPHAPAIAETETMTPTIHVRRGMPPL